MLAQAVPIAPVAKSAKRKDRAKSARRTATGALCSALRRVRTSNAEWITRKERVSAGSVTRRYERNVRAQDGSCGWMVAQERCVMRGCAPEERGAVRRRAGVGGGGADGKRVGDVK